MMRIYQGRVNQLELLNPAKEFGPPLDKTLWEECLLEHHGVFQDAINYYLVVLAALGEPDPTLPQEEDGQSSIRQFRKRLAEVWSSRMIDARATQSFRDSLAKYLPLPEKATLEQAFGILLGRDMAPPRTLRLAVDSLLEDISGGSKIQQEGRGSFPRFCEPSFHGQFPRGRLALEKGAAKKELPAQVWADAFVLHPLESLGTLSFHFFANPAGGDDLSESESVDLLKTCVGFFREKGLLGGAESARLLGAIDALDPKPRIPAYAGGSINKAALQSRFYAYLLLRYVETSTLCATLLRDCFPKPKTGKTLRNAKSPSATTAGRLTSLGEDPVKLARGTRGFVFRAFTSLPAWNTDPAPDRIAWKEFDIAAFKEALKVINLYNLKSQERRERLLQARMRLEVMEGLRDPADIKASAETEEKPPVLLGSDTRWPALKALLATLQEGDDIRGISRRSLRGFPDILREWKTLLAARDASDPEATANRLVDVVSQRQREEPFSIGDVTLFKALCRPENWELWSPAPDHPVRDLLMAHCEYLDLADEIERLTEPVRLRPADSISSPRQYLFKGLTGKSRPVHQREATAVEVSLARQENGLLKETRAILRYTAPRLFRDSIRGADTLHGEWLLPMVKALKLEEPPPVDFAEAEVGLMPSRDRHGKLRFLLNFPIDVDETRIAEQLGIAAKWSKQTQFGLNKVQTGLLWPEMADAPDGATAWWNNSIIQANGFRVLGIDLGQRVGAAASLLEVRSDINFERTRDGRERKPLLDIGVAGEKTWSAAILTQQLLRLPGEDARQLSHGEWQDEPFGSKGRKANAEEAQEGEALLAEAFRAFGEDEAAFREDFLRASFPAQNDMLLKRLGRARSHAQTIHSLAWRVRSESMAARTVQEILDSPHLAFLHDAARAGDTARLAGELDARFQQLRDGLRTAVLALAHRIVPLRGWHWEWRENPAAPGNHALAMTRGGTTRRRRGQRGLSLRRIEQIEGMRRLLQSLNKLEQCQPGVRPDFGHALSGREVPDPCPDILAKLERLKKQRVQQLCHQILQQALGLRLEPGIDPRAPHEHGRYAKAPGRRPVDFIAIEGLNRYLASQGRGPSENRKLMQWCHRQIALKLEEMAAPFGIRIVHVQPGYTSRFQASSGAAGCRFNEISDLPDWQLEGVRKALGLPVGDLEMIRQWQQRLRERNAKPTGPRTSIFIPADGGQLFSAVESTKATEIPAVKPVQADLNASVNIALRAVAAPVCVRVFPQIRLKRAGGAWVPRAENKREKALWQKLHPPRFQLASTEHAHGNAFLDAASLIKPPAAQAVAVSDAWHPHFSPAKSLWERVREEFRRRLVAENCRRLGQVVPAKWSRPLDEDIPY